MSALTYKKNDDLESGSLDKMTVFQECISGFNASPIQSKKCRTLLTKLVHLINLGEVFPAEEATSLFFSITKLFQHKDPALRQMVYIAIKELAPTANDVIMVTSSIMKDIQSTSDAIYKPDAIRALIRIIDSSTVQSIERLMKTAITDKHSSVASAALVSSYHLTSISRDVVRRWASETQETLQAKPTSFLNPTNNKYNADTSFFSPNGPSIMYQYHAIGLLYQLRSHDKMALMRMIQHLTDSNSTIVNPNAFVMIVRLIAKLIDEDENLSAPLVKILVDLLRNRSDMVNLEVAKTILQIRGPISPVATQEALNLIQSFLTSPRTVTKFAAIRILNRYAMDHPQDAGQCNTELEGLISDSSRSIATYAITTLLKTGNETSVDRLMSQISGFMNEISDEFKIIVIDAIRSLALKFPSKYQRMLSFLAGGLRDDGGIAYKTAVVEGLFDMIRYIPASKEAALGHLSELVEDCEFAELSVRILHLLGSEGPSTSNPTKYIRYIYNRVVLENAVIRAAAVTALSKFALVDDPKVKKSIKVLLTRCLNDVTDEVRDRAALALRLIELNKEEAVDYIAPKTFYSIPQFERELTQYLSSGDKSVFLVPFDVSIVSRVTEEQSRAEALEIRSKALLGDSLSKTESSGAATSSAAASEEKQRIERELLQDKAKEYAAALSSIPEFESYGPLLKSSSPVALTESEMEYVVKAVKHFFKDHLVIQYDVTNTYNEYVLENVIVEIQDGFDEDFVIPIDSLVPDSTGTIYVSMTRPQDYTVASFYNTLKFISKEIDPSTNEPQEEGFDDEYNLENIEITAGDYLVPAYVGNFSHQWDELASHESSSTYQLGTDMDINSATEYLIKLLSMMPLESSDIPTSSASHLLKLYGRTITGDKVAAQARMVYSSRNGVTIKVTVRAQDESISALVSEALENA